MKKNIKRKDFILFVEWLRKQSFASNPYLEVDYLFNLWKTLR